MIVIATISASSFLVCVFLRSVAMTVLVIDN
jgi:hypothetical protein